MLAHLVRTKLTNGFKSHIPKSQFSTFSRLNSAMSSSGHPNEALVASKLFTLKGQKALVTGGGSGIGLVCSEILGQDVDMSGVTDEILDDHASSRSKRRRCIHCWAD